MGKGNNFRQGLGFALRLGVELMVATMIGALMGYALDHFAGTDPWGLAVGVILGGAAGCLNVYRAAMSMQFDEDNETPPDNSDQ